MIKLLKEDLYVFETYVMNKHLDIRKVKLIKICLRVLTI
jgi:hypothetical protein